MNRFFFRAAALAAAVSLLFTLATAAAAEAQEPLEPVPLDNWVSPVGQVASLTEDGGLRLDKRGWIRTPQESLDFVLKLRVRVLSPETEAAIILRGWMEPLDTKPKTGYRVGLHGPAGKPPKALLTGYSRPVKATSSIVRGGIAFDAVGEWRDVEFLCRLDRIEVKVDGRVIGQFEGNEPQAGFFGLEVTKGVVEFGNISVGHFMPIIGTATDAKPENAGALTSPKPEDGLIIPGLRRQVKPRYSLHGLLSRIAGIVVLRVTVLTDGRPGRIEVSRSLGCDLDLEAVAAARRWQFTPAKRQGTVVPCVVTIEMNYELR